MQNVTLPSGTNAFIMVEIQKNPNLSFFDISDAPFVVKPARVIILLDWTGSMEALRTTGETRCVEALQSAKNQVIEQLADNPNGRVSVWTFQGSAPVRLTDFVEQSAAIAELDLLNDVLCADVTPLAAAVCDAVDYFEATVAATDRLLIVITDGAENSSQTCGGLYSVGGTTCGTFDDLSWQKQVCDKTVGKTRVSFEFWENFGGAVTSSAFEEHGTEMGTVAGTPIIDADRTFFTHLAETTGGSYIQRDDGIIVFGPSGACCLPDGFCVGPIEETVCDVANGLYRGDDTICDDIECLGACCDRVPVGGACTFIPGPTCDSADPQIDFFNGQTCEEVEDSGACAEHSGACCDATVPGGGCTDVVPASQCNTADSQITWFKDTLCADVLASGECAEHRGACCDATVPGGGCTDDVAASQCNTADSQITWFKDTLCADVLASGECAEHRGACCDATETGGGCTDDVAASQCNTADSQITWFKDTLCADVLASGECAEHTGACCDGVTGFCTPDVPESECLATRQQPTFFKGLSCTDPSVFCEPHRGACCDNQPIVALCDDNVLEADCGGEKNKWFAKSSCSGVDCEAQPIPTVSEWGLVILALVLLVAAKLYFGRREIEATD